MQRYVALLRGIAPSGENMTNDKLRGVFEKLGFDRVGSVLASGNIVFDSPGPDAAALERRVEAALTRDLGLASRALVRSHPELRDLLASDPFPGLTHGRGTYLTATFVKHASFEPEALEGQPDPLTRVVGYDPAARVVLAVTDNTVAGSTPVFMSWLEKVCGKDITTRSWLTVQRIVAKLEA